MVYHQHKGDSSEHDRLQRRVRDNPFYNDFVRVLANHNLHTHTVHFGPSGGIHVQVLFDAPSGNEATQTFLLPAKFGHDHVKGEYASVNSAISHFKNVIEGYLRRGFRVPRRQLVSEGPLVDLGAKALPPTAMTQALLKASTAVKEPTVDSVFKKEPPMSAPISSAFNAKPDPVLEEQVALHVEHADDEPPPPVDHGPPMRVDMTINFESLMFLLQISACSPQLVRDDDKRLRVSVDVGTRDLSTFLTEVNGTTAEIHGILPAATSVPVSRESAPLASEEEVGSRREAIFANWPEGKEIVAAADIVEAIMAKTGSPVLVTASRRQIMDRVSSTLGIMATKGELVRVDRGAYRKVPAKV